MRKTFLLFLFLPVLSYSQAEQRYADGTATDQDGNTFEWINYGTQDWAIENAEVVTYRDGTPIPQVNDQTAFDELTTGAWCYYNNDSNNKKLYNGFAIFGIHDNDSETPNKDFSPTGWRIPTDSEWNDLSGFLFNNGYGYFSNDTSSVGQSMASTSGWISRPNQGTPGYDQNNTNNSSGFNAFPEGYRLDFAGFKEKGNISHFWSKSIYGDGFTSAWTRYISAGSYYLFRNKYLLENAYSVRFVRDTSTASINDYSNDIAIYPNPTSSILIIEGNKEYQINVYDLLGNKVLEAEGSSINMEHLSTATYIVKATDKSNNEEMTYKVVKN